jgi:hypothetical protein
MGELLFRDYGGDSKKFLKSRTAATPLLGIHAK